MPQKSKVFNVTSAIFTRKWAFNTKLVLHIYPNVCLDLPKHV